MSELERLNKALETAFSKINIHKKGDMSNFLDYRRNYFSDITRGASPISDSFLTKISDKVGINPKWVRTGEGKMLKDDTLIDGSSAVSSGGIPQSQLDILVQAIDRLSTSEVNNSENVKELIAQGRQQTENITRLIDLLCQKGVDIEPLIDKEKGGLRSSGRSDDNSATDADRANVG